MPNPSTDRARNLRLAQTIFERKFWARVRNRGLGGLKFKRQAPIGPYIVDFLCEEAALVVELDGDQHGLDSGIAHDARRDAYLGLKGYAVLRIWNGDFMRDPVATLDHVLAVANSRIADR